MTTVLMATTSAKSFKKKRLFRVAKELNKKTAEIESFLNESGHGDALSGTGINASITKEEAYIALLDRYRTDKVKAARVQELKDERKAREVGRTEPKRASQSPPAKPQALPITIAPEEKQPGPTIEEVLEPLPPSKVPPLPPEPTAESEEGTAQEPVVAKPTVEPLPEEPASATEETPAAPVQPPEESEHPEDTAPSASEVAAAPSEEAAAQPNVDASAEETKRDPALSAVEAPEAEPPPIDGPPAKEAPAEKVVEPETDLEEGVEPPKDAGVIKAADRVKLQGTTIVGKLDLKSVDEKTPTPAARPKRKRKRKGSKAAAQPPAPAGEAKPAVTSQRKKSRKRGKAAVRPGDVEQTVQETLREVEQSTTRVRQRRRRARRQQRAEERQHEQKERAVREQTIRLTEFVSTGEFADLMGIPANDVISVLLNAGMMVSINQRLDADTISFVADEFDFEVEFITEFGTDDIDLEEDDPTDLAPRAPVVTVMGHVDHGKTSLLDYIRRTNVAVGESGGITQHIGAYKVKLDGGRIVTFLDTPGHAAFTAMRARGAKVTDVVILVVAADDAVMPQTIEAINHARAAEVSIIVAVNKIDLADANPKRVMQQLSEQGVLVEQYGGQVQCAQVSAKSGQGVDDLLEKVLLEADILELKANPNRHAQGIVIESRLDRGRGNVATILVQNGTLHVQDPFVAGIYAGRVRAIFDETDVRIKKAGPSEPALVLGLPGQPNVGDQFICFDDVDEAKEIAQRRQQIWREQKMRQYKHVRLEDIGRRMALGDFNELNLIIKADVGGSVEAINDAILKLSTEEVAVNIIHSGVGAINESDVMLASASDAIIIGFQVRPTLGARTASEREEIDIHTYSIIYDAIEDVRDALEGLLQPEETEKVTAVVEVRDLFKVPKAGTIAGCYVMEGKVRRSDTVRILRESVVIYNGRVSSLRRFKDDVREVSSGYECGIGIENYNDLKVGDQFEVYEIVETKRTLDS